MGYLLPSSGLRLSKRKRGSDDHHDEPEPLANPHGVRIGDQRPHEHDRKEEIDGREHAVLGSS